MEEKHGTKCSQDYTFLPFVNWHESLYSINQRNYGVKEWLQKPSYSVLDLLTLEVRKCSSTKWYILPVNTCGIIIADVIVESTGVTYTD